MDTKYAWLLLFLPLAIAAFNWLFLKKHGNIATLTSTLSALVTLVVSIGLLGQTGSDGLSWLSIQSENVHFNVEFGFLLDALSTRMMVVVTGIGFLVHLFSWGYMADDPAKTRYYSGLSLFMFSMTGIVLANNLAMTFICWELVGFCSYLLIGHYFTKKSAAEASKKAFITNRVGDFGFLIGILAVWALAGTFSFVDMKLSSSLDSGLLTIVILCLFCGAVGKSAQFPLHVWLPDAMEGPTPVSALMHAATMVAAGVYMMVRIQTSLGTEVFTDTACNVIVSIGAITALLAALMATRQNDIKRILAYSTLSQLGYMIMAVGLLAGEAAMFHLYTHAWFKALLFLGAGAIIVSCHHEQDIWKMGGILGKMKLTSLCFIMGTAALIAIPGTSGFFSKESILVAALEKNPLFFWLGAFVALLTTFYMARLFMVVFCGKPRAKCSEHAKEVNCTMWLPLVILAILAVVSGYGFIADKLVPSNSFAAEPLHVGLPFYASLGALIIGGLIGIIMYSGNPVQDKASGNAISKLFANRFYIDDFYNKILIHYIQGSISALIDFFDQYLISGLIVGGCARISSGLGRLLRYLQCGNIVAYSVLFGAGILLIVFFSVFYR